MASGPPLQGVLTGPQEVFALHFSGPPSIFAETTNNYTMLNSIFLFSLSSLFVSGGTFCMLLVSLLLIALLVAAWKAPRWVKEIGLAALVVGIFSALLGIAMALDTLQMAGDVAPEVVAGGLKVCLICPMYGMIVYFISLVIRIIQKPRA